MSAAEQKPLTYAECARDLAPGDHVVFVEGWDIFPEIPVLPGTVCVVATNELATPFGQVLALRPLDQKIRDALKEYDGNIWLGQQLSLRVDIATDAEWQSAAPIARHVVTARSLLADEAAIKDLTEDAINAIALMAQKRIGQHDGGIAGNHFSDDERRAEVELVIRAYLQHEAIYEDEEEPDCVRTGHHRDTGRGVCADCGKAL